MEGRYKWKDHYNKLHDVNFAYEGICASCVVSDKKKTPKNKTPKQIPEIIKFQIGFSKKEAIRPSEDSAWQLLAEHAIKVQLPAHQIILYILKRPLMVSQFQCLPLSLKIKNKQHMKFPRPHATNPPPLCS